MPGFHIAVLRGDLVESVHRVSVAVTDRDGRLAASAGDPHLVTFWRSAAKPFQALPLVEDGAVDRFGLGEDELALACASHSSHPEHLALVDRFLARIGCREDDLACGPHLPLDPARARDVAREGLPLTPRWSNCSGKHAGMLALARHHGWPLAGYQRRGHPVQDRVAAEVAGWTGVPVEGLAYGVDGCTTVCFGLPLRRMAAAYARLVTSSRAGAVTVRRAMTGRPAVVAGPGRYCTELMRTLGGAVLAKVGAEGVYGAGVPEAGLGIGLKVEDGDMRCAPLALHGVLVALHRNRLLPPAFAALEEGLAAWGSVPVLNTREERVGEMLVRGELQFGDPR